MQDITAVVLAAGYSSRMGQFKPLLRFGGSTVLERAILSCERAGVGKIILVLGHRSEEIKETVAHLPVQLVWNERYAEGMFSSIKRALVSPAFSGQGFFLLPGDMPLVQPETLKRLGKAFLPKGVVFPQYHGRKGHPPLVASSLREQILNWDGPGGLRGYLHSTNYPVDFIDVTDRGILLDLDHPEDYQRAQALYQEISADGHADEPAQKQYEQATRD